MCSTDKAINAESPDEETKIKTPEQIEKELRKIKRLEAVREESYVFSLSHAKRLAALVREHGGMIRYIPNHGISIDKISCSRMPEPIQTQLNYGLKNLGKYFAFLHEADSQACAFNAYLYLLEMKRQKYRILDIPVSEAKVTLDEWRNCILKEITADPGHLNKIENRLIQSGKLILSLHGSQQCLISAMEANGEELNLKEDYRISFNEWMNTDRVIFMEIEHLKLAFPCKRPLSA